MISRTLLLLCLCFIFAFAESECFYSENIIDSSRLKSSDELNEKKWQKNNLTFFARTNDGSELNVKYWACENYAVEAQLKVKKILKHDEITKKIIWLAKYILDSKDVQVIERNLYFDGKYPIFLKGEYFEKLMINISSDKNIFVITVFGST